jgi:hypothetical protein
MFVCICVSSGCDHCVIIGEKYLMNEVALCSQTGGRPPAMPSVTRYAGHFPLPPHIFRVHKNLRLHNHLLQTDVLARQRQFADFVSNKLTNRNARNILIVAHGNSLLSSMRVPL